jgi:muramoyltetrapeptide carboxypeptidase
MVRPSFLENRSVVRIISPAGVIDSELVDGAENCLKSWGLIVRRGKHTTDRKGRFAGDVGERLADLQEAFDDPDCSAIFCSRGGYGSIQLLDQIDMSGFRNRPKWVIGYSDITMLHALLQREGFESIHGGMVTALKNALLQPSASIQYLREILFGKIPGYFSEPQPLNHLGIAQGTLIGGNLSILYSLRGTPFDYIPANSILFIEDIGEKPYVVDRIMYNLKLGGILQRISGLIVGQFSDYQEDPLFGKTIYEIVSSAVSKYSYPVCFDFPVGHVEKNWPLISGSEVRLEVTQKAVHLHFKQ